jgi:hypothetical protein
MSTLDQTKPVKQRTRAYWLAGYVLYLAAIVAGIVWLRGSILDSMGTPEAQAEWEAWRQSPPNQDQRGPVRRRPPPAEEPPALLLMRDHFAVVLSGAVIFGSLLFAAIAIAVRGVLSPAAIPPGVDGPRQPGSS